MSKYTILKVFTDFPAALEECRKLNKVTENSDGKTGYFLIKEKKNKIFLCKDKEIKEQVWEKRDPNAYGKRKEVKEIMSKLPIIKKNEGARTHF